LSRWRSQGQFLQAVDAVLRSCEHSAVLVCDPACFTFEKVMRQVKAKYVVGLTATPTRKDGHHPIIYMQCGPTRFSMSARTMTEATPFEHKVIPRHTEFRTTAEPTDIAIYDVYAALSIRKFHRNRVTAI